jgi:protein phosphatase 1G
LTTDHKPSVPAEKQRIENAGRSVTVTGGASRIDNGIAVSRSIGIVTYFSLWGYAIYQILFIYYFCLYFR